MVAYSLERSGKPAVSLKVLRVVTFHTLVDRLSVGITGVRSVGAVCLLNVLRISPARVASDQQPNQSYQRKSANQKRYQRSCIHACNLGVGPLSFKRGVTSC